MEKRIYRLRTYQQSIRGVGVSAPREFAHLKVKKTFSYLMKISPMRENVFAVT